MTRSLFYVFPNSKYVNYYAFTHNNIKIVYDWDYIHKYKYLVDVEYRISYYHYIASKNKIIYTADTKYYFVDLAPDILIESLAIHFP